ncbi:MAG: alpha/beta hydrolase-fold protein [Oscillibacter sp.]|nr:alpha/beta hydrolase-fold protein [Oscillibacter sp.]
MKYILFFIVLLSSLNMNGQYFKAKKITINEHYQAKVYLPDNYKESRLKYPVVYVFDGQMLFDILVATCRYNWDIYPPFIVVGIEQDKREQELINQGENNLNGNEFFYDILSSELFSKMGKKYRINSIRVGIGHSHGGSFVLNAALDKTFFNAVISISPTLWVNKGSFLKNYPLSASAWKGIKKFYCGYGEHDFPIIQKDVDVLFQSKDSNILYQKDVFKNEDHNSAIFMGMRKGIEFIFQDFYLNEETWEQMEELRDDSLFYSHFSRLSSFWGEEIIPMEEDYNSLGYYYIENEEWEKAEKIFKKALYYYPFSANLYDSLGELFENRHELKEAKRHYLKALRLARKDKEMKAMIPLYEEHVKKIKIKLIEQQQIDS